VSARHRVFRRLPADVSARDRGTVPASSVLSRPARCPDAAEPSFVPGDIADAVVADICDEPCEEEEDAVVGDGE